MKIALTIMAIFINFIIMAQHGRVSDTYGCDEEPLSPFLRFLGYLFWAFVIYKIFFQNRNKPK